MSVPVYREILARVPRSLNNNITLKHIFIDAAAWIALVYLNAKFPSIFASGLSAIGFAVLTFRAFGMMHECVHSAGLSNRRLNNVVGWIYGVLCYLPFRSWQKVHLDHHMWTGNLERDPTMGIILRFKKDGFKVAPYASWSWIHWVPTFAFLQHVLFWKATRGRDVLSVVVSILFLGGVVISFGPLTTALGVTLYLYMVEVINFPHHLELEQKEGEARFPAYDQARFARSCIYPKWFARVVLLNFNLHTEHHLYPAHPWYQLPQLHEEAQTAGLLINVCEGNEWIIRNRSRSIETVLLESFSSEQEKKAA